MLKGGIQNFQTKIELKKSLKNFSRPSEFLEASNENAERKLKLLDSDSIPERCKGINFFANYFGSIDKDIMMKIIEVASSNEFDIIDTVCPLLVNISNNPTFIKKCKFLVQIIELILDIIQSSAETQFTISGFEALSNFCFYSYEAALFLFQVNFVDFVFDLLDKMLKYLRIEEDDICFIDCLYITENILKMLSGILIHDGLTNSSFALKTINYFILFLKIKNQSHSNVIKGFIVTNVYWIAVSASDDIIRNIIIPEFFDAISFSINTNDNDLTAAAFSTILKITSHDDNFSLCFVLNNFLSIVRNSFAWDNEVKLEFCKILHNFAMCKDERITDSIFQPQIIDFLVKLRNEGSFYSQKEIILIFCLLINFNYQKYLELIINKLSFVFNDISDYLTNDDIFFNIHIIYSFNIIVQNYSSKEFWFINEELFGILDSFILNENEFLSYYSKTLKEMIRQ